MSKTPVVSVVIATYNRAHLLEETLESVLGQRLENYEVIVVDDGSTDETPKIVESFAEKIRYYRQENRGAAAARNLGVRQARAPWIAIQDSDDLSTPDHLQALYEYVESHPTCAMVFANGSYLEGREHNRDTIIPLQKSRRLAMEGVGLIDLFEKSIVRLQAALISKAAFDAVGGMDESLRVCHDLDLFLRIYMSAPVAYLDRVVFRYRKHQGNISRNEELRLVENIRIIETFMRDFPAAKDILGAKRVARRLAYRYYRLAKGRWQRKQFAGAREAIGAALSSRPYSLKYRYYQLRWRAGEG
jgi:glycosyltransferase involved in cell wall biosynthesis